MSVRDFVVRDAGTVIGTLTKGGLGLQGMTPAQVAHAGLRIADLPSPIMAVARPELEHNISVMRDWCDAQALLLAPHGKTTMTPEIWRRQLDAGAWGITVANEHQLEVALATGLLRVQVANNLVRREAASRLRDALAGGAVTDVLVWIDSEAALRTLVVDDTVARPICVLVDIGGRGGRTGVRDLDQAVELARTAARTPGVALRGVAGYEGAVADERVEHDRWKAYLDQVLRAARAIAPLVDTRAPLISIGGSADIAKLVRHVRSELTPEAATIMIRSGVYVVHDDGHYAARPETELPFRAAVSVWARVLGTPEPGLALLDAARRDLSDDDGKPIALGFHRGPEPLAKQRAPVVKLNDQHAFLDTSGLAIDLRVGDLVELGVSHPCTTFDRWPIVLEVGARGSAAAPVVGVLRTYF